MTKSRLTYSEPLPIYYAFDSAEVTKIKRALAGVDDAGEAMSERVRKFLTGKLSDADLTQFMNMFNETSEDETPNILEAEAEPLPADPSTKAMTNKERNSLGIDAVLEFSRRYGKRMAYTPELAATATFDLRGNTDGFRFGKAKS